VPKKQHQQENLMVDFIVPKMPNLKI